MQAYNAEFAQLYNARWAGFAQSIAPLMRTFYESTPAGQAGRSLLDLCCGTGQLAVLFLEAGYRVTGLDSSEAMLVHARENARRFVDTGQARFVQGDAADFDLPERFGLVVSTFDALNHLADEQALQNCFRCVFRSLEDEGLFLFDLNTRLGLRRWNSINVDESSPDSLVVTRGIFDESGGRAWTKITGFLRAGDGRYSRSDLVAYNTVFDLPRVRAFLLEAGWRDVHLAAVQDLATPLAEPESQGRVFFVARK